MPQNMTNLDPILKEVYTKTLNEQLNNETRALNRIDSTSDGTASDPYGGKYVVFPLHTKRNSGIGARNENEALPNAGYQGTARATLKLKNQYGALELSGQTFELATKEYQSFANAVDLEMENIKEDLSKDRNRQYFGTGNGRVATVVSVAGQVITVDTVQHLQDGEVLDAVIPATGVLHGTAGLIVNDGGVDPVGITVTVTGTTTGIVAGDILVRTGNWNREWTGLGAMIDNASTLYGINPATVGVWKSEVNTQGGTTTALSEATLMRMTDRIYRNGAKPSVILTTLGVQRAYWLLLTGQRRFTDTKDFAGGYKGLEFNAGSVGVIPMIADIDAPASTALFVNEKAINMYRPHGFKFIDRDGSMWKQKVDSTGRYDAYVAQLYEYSELGTTRRNSHGIVTNITEDVS